MTHRTATTRTSERVDSERDGRQPGLGALVLPLLDRLERLADALEGRTALREIAGDRFGRLAFEDRRDHLVAACGDSRPTPARSPGRAAGRRRCRSTAVSRRVIADTRASAPRERSAYSTCRLLSVVVSAYSMLRRASWISYWRSATAPRPSTNPWYICCVSRCARRWSRYSNAATPAATRPTTATRAAGVRSQRTHAFPVDGDCSIAHHALRTRP